MDPYIKCNYWLNKQFGSGIIKWNTLEFNGVLFPPNYKKHNIPLIYKGKEIILNNEAEEYATIYAKYTNTEYINNKVFKKNFWKDWKNILDNSEIEDLDNCDFSLIYKHILTEKEKKSNLSKEEKELIKQKRDKLEEIYKYAIVDGKKQQVGNYRIEPPGIFIGRGCHPKLGKIKKRILPNDIILNIGKNSVIPKAYTIDDTDNNFILKEINNNWKSIIHDNKVEWLASWKDNILGKNKYVFFGDKSEFKAQSDINKFDLARKLNRKINAIRKTNNVNLLSDNLFTKQLATALYFIDKFALRVGNEKREDEADTVGVSSLRVEHLELMDDYIIKLDFLGKDSVRYVNKVKVDQQIYDNIKLFMNNKNKYDQIFDLITSNDINKYLQQFMKNLTAKVFRTYNASHLFQTELEKISKKYKELETDDKINILLDEFNKANAKVALLCNHQKNVSKNFNEQLEKINAQIKLQKSKKNKWKNSKSKMKKEKIAKIDKKISELKIKKQLKIELKDISLGTSKTNYIDPRITISFMKKFNLPIDRIFTKNLQDKFFWAFEVDDHFIF